MDWIIQFINSVASNIIAGVIVYYICKGLDGDKKDGKKGNEHEG